jgi:prepilin-type N-terminal cleavage/methylation domain-containing protein
MRSKRSQAGVTLIEMLIVMTIVGVLVGVSYPGIASGLDSVRMRAATDSVATFLIQARTRMDRSQDGVLLTLDKSAGKLEIRGSQPALAKELVLEEGISILRIHPEPPGDPVPVRHVVLTPGAPFPAFAIELLNRRGQRRLIRMDPLSSVPIVETPLEDVSTVER